MVKRKLFLFDSSSSSFLIQNLTFSLFLQILYPLGDLGAKYNDVEFILDMFLESLSHYSATFISTREYNITIFLLNKYNLSLK